MPDSCGALSDPGSICPMNRRRLALGASMLSIVVALLIAAHFHLRSPRSVALPSLRSAKYIGMKPLTHKPGSPMARAYLLQASFYSVVQTVRNDLEALGWSAEVFSSAPQQAFFSSPPNLMVAVEPTVIVYGDRDFGIPAQKPVTAILVCDGAKESSLFSAMKRVITGWTERSQ